MRCGYLSTTEHPLLLKTFTYAELLEVPVGSLGLDKPSSTGLMMFLNNRTETEQSGTLTTRLRW